MSGTEVVEPLTTCTGDTPVDGYQVTADPRAGRDRRTFFGTNVDLVIYESAETFRARCQRRGAPSLGQEIKRSSRR